MSWCTMWRGTPQDCMEHFRNGHDVPWISRIASIERFVPPWTVRRELWTELLRQEHSGISTDIMLFSDLGLSLTHHYRVYRGGLPHAAFRGDYLTRLRALLPTPPSTNGEPASSPESVRGATPRSKIFDIGCSKKGMRRVRNTIMKPCFNPGFLQIPDYTYPVSRDY